MKSKICIFLFAALTLISCDSLLNQEPYGAFTADQLDDNSVEGLLAAAYAGLNAHYFGNNEAFAGPSTNWIFDVRSDDAYKGGGAITMEANIHQLEVGIINSDNVSLEDKWKNDFYGITRVHKAMKALDEISNIAHIDQMRGELMILRAWYYFDMVRIFKHVPYFTYTEDPSFVRNDVYTQDSIMRMLQQDLEKAFLIMEEESLSPARFNKYTAAALMAKISAQLSDWPMVEKYAALVIQSGKYQLYNNFADMSKIEFDNQYESIIALQCVVTSDFGQINWSNLLNTTYSDGNLYGTGDDFFIASQDLADCFRTDANGLPYLDPAVAPQGGTNRMNGGYKGNTDPRVDFTIARIGLPFRGHLYTRKWCRAYDIYGEFSGKKWLVEPESDQMVRGFPWGASNLNFIFLRYADIILLYAEALIEQNKNLDIARQHINMIREKAARSIDPYYSPVDLNPMITNYKVGEYPSAGWTQDYARKAVRMERRIELAMEGHRWFDLCRWGIAVETMNAYYQSESELRSYLRGASLSEQNVYMPTPIEEVRTADGLYK
ncbi:MAG: RagB/SusD family nutrient uptake outer membrane protein [Paludibacteraceae bacterium]|nr:RagB/SusD family nutrient uptake outer membrane protein [Paludibacteraceae bacterium]